MKIGNINVNGGNVQFTAGTITIDNKDVALKKAMKELESLRLNNKDIDKVIDFLKSIRK